MSNKDYKRKKSRAERKKYKNSLGERGTGIDSTYEYTSGMLSGSDSFYNKRDEIPQQEMGEPVEGKSIAACIHDWIRKNAVETFLSVIIIPIAIWLVASVINMQREEAVNEYRIGQIEKEIDKLSDDIPNKESLEMELENIKEEINDLDVEELESRMEKLEQSVDQYE